MFYITNSLAVPAIFVVDLRAVPTIFTTMQAEILVAKPANFQTTKYYAAHVHARTSVQTIGCG